MNKVEELKKLKKELEDKRTDYLDEIIISIFKSNSWIKNLVFYGYTPSFNDGDSCVHIPETLINSIDDYGQTQPEFESIEYAEITRNMSKEERECIKELNKKLREENKDAIDIVHDEFAKQYETDFQVVITLKGGRLKKDKDNYCEDY